MRRRVKSSTGNKHLVSVVTVILLRFPSPTNGNLIVACLHRPVFLQALSITRRRLQDCVEVDPGIFFSSSSSSLVLPRTSEDNLGSGGSSHRITYAWNNRVSEPRGWFSNGTG